MLTTPEEISPVIDDERTNTVPPAAIIDVPPPDEVIPELVDRNAELMQPARLDPPEPPPELVAAVVRHFNMQRASLLGRVADIESLLGFIREDGAALAVRVAKLEAFCGLKG